jgi:hypothetical protein
VARWFTVPWVGAHRHQKFMSHHYIGMMTDFGIPAQGGRLGRKQALLF